MAIRGIGEGSQRKQKGKLWLPRIVGVVGASQLARRVGMIKFQGKGKRKDFFLNLLIHPISCRKK